MSFDFEYSYLLYNNLGGRGPQDSTTPPTPPVIRFVNVGAISLPNGTMINFDVEVSNTSLYVPENSRSNGFINHKFCQINLACDQRVQLRASLKRSCATAPVATRATRP